MKCRLAQLASVVAALALLGGAGGPAWADDHDHDHGHQGQERQGPPAGGREASHGESHHDGPQRNGPSHDGPSHDGPSHDGPSHDGRSHGGPSHAGPPAAHSAHGGPGWHLDSRYHHNHYYPPRGYALPVLPRGALSIGYRGSNYFFHGGVWFRPFGGRFVVALPPIGIIVPALPPSYATLWIDGTPEYYANGVYYAPAADGYAVVAPPPDADEQPSPQAPDATSPSEAEPVIYPRNGQSPAQTEADHQACNAWAATQPSAAADASVFQRAVEACLDGRGYTVR